MRWIRTLVAAVVVGAGVVVGAPAASAVGAIVVTPSVGLVDGQTVTISGSGWEPSHTIGFCQAVVDATPSQDDCAAFPSLTSADADGNFSGNIFIQRVVNVHGTTVDCAAPSAPCVAAAADAGDIVGTAVTETLHFAGTPPLIVPGDATVPEGNSGTTNLAVPVTLSFSSTETITAQWATHEVSCFTTVPADPATDYAAASGTVTFLPGDTSETLPISVNGDTLVEPDECVAVELTNPTNATVGSNRFGGSDAFGVIESDDTLIPDLIIKRRSDGVLLFDNQYSSFPSPYFHSIAAGGFWTYAILVQNDGNSTGDIVVQASSPTAPFDVQYFYGYYDVTAAVEGSGLLLPAMTPGETRPLAVRFHADAGTEPGTSGEITMGAVPSPPLPVGDVLRLRVDAT